MRVQLAMKREKEQYEQMYINFRFIAIELYIRNIRTSLKTLCVFASLREIKSTVLTFASTAISLNLPIFQPINTQDQLIRDIFCSDLD